MTCCPVTCFIVIGAFRCTLSHQIFRINTSVSCTISLTERLHFSRRGLPAQIKMKTISLRVVSLVFYDYCRSHPSKYGSNNRIMAFFSLMMRAVTEDCCYMQGHISPKHVTLKKRNKTLICSYKNVPQRQAWKQSLKGKVPRQICLFTSHFKLSRSKNAPASLIKATLWRESQ